MAGYEKVEIKRGASLGERPAPKEFRLSQLTLPCVPSYLDLRFLHL